MVGSAKRKAKSVKLKEEESLYGGKRGGVSSLNNDKILVRLKRVEGQMGGIIKMYEKRRGCSDIVQQIIAVREALGSVAKILLRDEVVRCARRPKEGFEKTLENLLKFT